jgi:hypothetical protein
MCVDEVTCDGREPEALIVTTVTTVTFAWSVIVVMVVTITRIVMVAEGYMPRRKGSFLAINPCGRRQRGIALPSGCKPRFAGFAVCTQQGVCVEFTPLKPKNGHPYSSQFWRGFQAIFLPKTGKTATEKVGRSKGYRLNRHPLRFVVRRSDTPVRRWHPSPTRCSGRAFS